MAMCFDGVSDTLSSSLLAAIQWEVRYGSLIGMSVDSPAWEHLLGKEGHGTWQWVSSPASGSTVHTVNWHRDDEEFEDGYKPVIKFRLIDAIQPF